MCKEGDPSTFLEGFIQHVQTLCQDSSFQYLKGVLEENSNLKERNHILDITNDENHRAIAKLQVQLDDCSKRHEEQSEEMAALTQERASLDEKMSQLELDAEAAKKELESNADAFSRLQTEVCEKSAALESKDAELESTKTDLTKTSVTLGSVLSDLEAAKAKFDETNATLDLATHDLDAAKIQIQESSVAIEAKDALLESVNDKLEEASAELESTKSQLQESTDRCSHLQAENNVKTSDLESLQVSLEEEKSALAAAQVALEKTTADLQSTRKDLDKSNTRLGELNALSFKLKSPPQDQTQQHLQNMFALSYNWAESLFADDLEETAFIPPTSSTTWAKMRNHSRVNRLIPLPLSNTREAKKMRISAILAILAWALAQYIFQPTYLLQCNELSDLLAGLADDDPGRENYLRSVLLPVQPSKQKSNGKKRIDQVVKEVFTTVSPVLPGSRHDAARGSLETACKQICGQWMRLQLLDEKIEPSFDAYDEEDWKLLHLAALEGDTSGGDPNAPADVAKGESAIADDDSHTGVRDIEEIAAVLWPSFLSFRGGESELISEGFVLAKAQVKPASSEEKTSMLQGMHRAARQISRRDRTKSFATNGEDMNSERTFLLAEPAGQDGGQSVQDASSAEPASKEADTRSRNGQVNGGPK